MALFAGDRQVYKPRGRPVVNDTLQLREQGVDVRAHIARLETRAEQLLNPQDNRIKRNLHSVLEVSRNAKAGQSSRANRNQAATELFLAQNLNFNLQEQQRLLNHISASSTTATSFTGMEGTSAADDSSPTDLPSFLNQKRNEFLQRAIEDAQNKAATQEREAVDRLLQEAWSRRKGGHSVIPRNADMSSSMLMDPSQGFMLDASAVNASVVGATSAASGPTSLSGVKNASEFRKTSAKQIAEFAAVIHVAQTSEWLNRLVDVVTQHSSTNKDAARVWFNCEAILRPVFDAETASATSSKKPSSVMSLHVASSRQALERAFFAKLISEACDIPLSKAEDSLAMHPQRAKEVIGLYAGEMASPWATCYLAMRSGRYDAAVLIAEDGLPSSVHAALTELSNTLPLNRNDAAPSDLAELKANGDHQSDPYFHAVAMLLATGSRNAPANEKRALEVAVTAEDTVWLRLALVRMPSARDNGAGHKMQSLVELQRELLADQQYLLEMVDNDVPRTINLLFHALLPSTALRMMMEDDNLVVDGTHLALVYDACNMLTCSSIEAPLDLDVLLRRYCASLLTVDRTQLPREAASPASSIFQYFHKTKRIPAFAALCADDAICVKLFGRGDTNSREGELLDGTPSRELLNAMDQIASRAAQSGNLRLAIRVLVVLESLCSSPSVKDSNRAVDSLRKGLEYVNVALSHACHPSHASQRSELLQVSKGIERKLPANRPRLPPQDVQTFVDLRRIVEFHQLVAQSSLDTATSVFSQLQFVPHNPAQVEHMAQAFNDDTGDSVQAAMPHTVVVFLQAARQQFHRLRGSKDAAALQTLAHSVVKWVSRWKFQPSQQQLQEIRAIEQEMNYQQ